MMDDIYDVIEILYRTILLLVISAASWFICYNFAERVGSWVGFAGEVVSVWLWIIFVFAIVCYLTMIAKGTFRPKKQQEILDMKNMFRFMEEIHGEENSKEYLS
jgi:hypothetical protein